MAPPRKVRTAAEEADRKAARAAAARQRRAQQSDEQRAAQTAARRRRREDCWVRLRENYAKRRRREDPEVRAAENEARHLRRVDPLVRAAENEARRLRRADPWVRAAENEARELRREDPRVRAAENEARQLRRVDPWVRAAENEARRLRRMEREARAFRQVDPQTSSANLADIISLQLFNLISSARLVHRAAAGSSMSGGDVTQQLEPGVFTEHEGDPMVSISAPSTSHKEEPCEPRDPCAGCHTKTGREYHRKLMWNISAQDAVIARNIITVQTKPKCERSVFRIPLMRRPLGTDNQHARIATKGTQTAMNMTHSVLTQTKPKALHCHLYKRSHITPFLY
ncbi:uncharacterized protein LOC119174185 isoform X2 [Rhipicephalus microplus]|uniref:uncharacterized protein LOC119174185 isoform X2 n=1 Tax=Rhipicephalus microplus TaxID=6941 RepID=UPI003F6C047A